MGYWHVVTTGGTVDIDATYGTYTTAFVGAGMPPLAHNVTEQAMIPGAMLQSIKVQPRVLQLQLLVQGATVAAYHSIRKTLLNAFKPNTGGALSPVQLRYTGAGGTVDTYGYYESGLEGNREGGARTPERLTARFICYDPWWYVPTATNVDIAESASVADANYVIGRVNGAWGALSTGLTSGTALFYGMALDASENLYIASGFTDVGDANGDGIVKWAGTAFSSLGTGLNSAGYCVAVGPDNSVYCGGLFTAAGGVADTAYIAKWDGTAWSALGTGASHAVAALAVGLDGAIYAGGVFTSMGGVADTAYIAKWDGAAWSALGTGMNGSVRGLAVGPDNALYAVGEFITAGGGTVTRAAKWNGTAWSALGTGLSNTGHAVTVAEDGSVYVAGAFLTAGDVADTAYVAKWDGSVWTPLGTGLNGSAYCLAIDSEGAVHVGGGFTAAGGLTVADRYAVWNGSTWTHGAIDLPGTATVRAIAVSDTRFYLGYNTAGTATAAAQTTVANSGSAPAYPTITIARTGGTTARLEYLKNETTGQALHLKHYELLAGETLTITLTPGAKAITSSFFGNVIGRALLPNSDFATWCLQPGNNTVSMYVYQVGSPTLTTTCTFNAPHWGADGVAT